MKKLLTTQPVEDDNEEINRATVEQVFDKIKRINDYRANVKRFFVGMDKVIDDIILAILIKEHILLEGKAGTAKSQVAKTVFHNIRGAKVFAIQLSKFMSEDYLFGAVNIKKLKEEGIIYHNTKNSIVEADFAFIDEVFDGSDPLIRSLLEVLNERTFTRNAQQINSPLNSAVMTTNFHRTNKEMEAILDRIIFKHDVKPLDDLNDVVRVIDGYIHHMSNEGKDEGRDKCRYNGHITFEFKNQLEFEDIKTVQAYIPRVTIPNGVKVKYVRLVQEFEKQTGTYISQRTKNKGIKVLMATALLNGTARVENVHFSALKNVLVGESTEQNSLLFDTIYSGVINFSEEDLTVLDTFSKIQVEVDTLKNSIYMSQDIKELNKFLSVADKIISRMTEKLGNAKSNNNIVKGTLDTILQDLQVAKHNAEAKIQNLESSSNEEVKKGSIGDTYLKSKQYRGY